MKTLHEVVKDVNLLYHESTYSKQQADRARLYAHSTAEQAAFVARDAHVGKLLLGHFSARYDDEQLLLSEARDVFPQSYLASENQYYDIWMRLTSVFSLTLFYFIATTDERSLER